MVSLEFSKKTYGRRQRGYSARQIPTLRGQPGEAVFTKILLQGYSLQCTETAKNSDSK